MNLGGFFASLATRSRQWLAKQQKAAVIFAIGLVGAALLVTSLLQVNKGAHMVLTGAIKLVRSQAVDDATVVVVDFHLVNPADFPFVVRKVDLILDIDHQPVEGAIVAEIDAKRFMDYYKSIGPKHNQSLMTREKVPSKATLDRMISARFELPEQRFQKRLGLKLRIEEMDGAITEIVQ